MGSQGVIEQPVESYLSGPDDPHTTMKTTETRTKPKLWEWAKRTATNEMHGHSARAMQRAVKLYKDHGGGYRGARSKNNSLHRWTKQKWRTMNGKPARRGSVTHRYLPDAKWGSLTPNQRRATDRKKVAGAKKGIRRVSNTKAAKVRSKCTPGLKF